MMSKAVNTVLRRIGYEVRSIDGRSEAHHRSLYRRIQPFTMTSLERVVAICDAIDYLERNDVSGAIAECGVWRGGSMMSAAFYLRSRHQTTRDLYLFDTFDGMVEPTNLDVSHQGVVAKSKWLRSGPRSTGSNWDVARLEDVQQNMMSTGYPSERIHFVKGKVEETIPSQAPDKIALLRIDTDWYESHAHVLAHLPSRMPPGAVIIFDDYGYWNGARLAIDEWIESWPTPLMLQRVDAWARMVVLP